MVLEVEVLWVLVVVGGYFVVVDVCVFVVEFIGLVYEGM